MQDSKIVWRLDNFLGASCMDFMDFWQYSEGVADVKSKPRVRSLVASVHKLFRLNLGFVDQGDVKATVMKITAEQTPK